jgi:tol-pal system protein YbgF
MMHGMALVSFKMVQLRWQVLLTFVFVIIGLISVTPSFAQSEDLKPILDRLQRIERDIKTLNIQVSRGEVNRGEDIGSPAAARAAVRLTDLEDELRATTGRVETVAQKIEDIGLRLDQLIADLDYRLSALEGNSPRPPQRVKISPSPGTVQQVLPGASKPGVLGVLSETRISTVVPGNGEDKNVAPPPARTEVLYNILPKGTTAERYAFAVGLLRQGDYEQAEKAFNEFMVAHPDDNLMDNARYWLAESFYVRGQYIQAAEFFMSGYQANDSAAKAPDMLLKLGMSLSKLDKNKDACASFAKLLDDFPKASSRILKKVALESKNTGCK